MQCTYPFVSTIGHKKLNVLYICSKHVDNSYILQMKQHEPKGQMLSHLGNVTYLLDVTNEFRGSNGCHYLVVITQLCTSITCCVGCTTNESNVC